MEDVPDVMIVTLYPAEKRPIPVPRIRRALDESKKKQRKHQRNGQKARRSSRLRAYAAPVTSEDVLLLTPPSTSSGQYTTGYDTVTLPSPIPQIRIQGCSSPLIDPSTRHHDRIDASSPDSESPLPPGYVAMPEYIQDHSSPSRHSSLSDTLLPSDSSTEYDIYCALADQ